MPDFNPPVKAYGTIIRSLAATKRWDDVLKHAAIWLGEQPDNPAAHCAMAGALIELKQPVEGAKHALAALEADPELPLAHQLLGEAHYQREDYRGAMGSVRTALALDPEDAALHFLLARVNLHLGELGEAFIAARRAREIDPDDADYAHLVILMQRMGASSAQSVYNEIAELKQALALDPENARMLGRIGEQYAQGLEDYAHAEDYLRQALAIDPTNRTLQGSLFEVVTQRDVVYRALGIPRRALGWVLERVWSPFAGLMLLVLAVGAVATVPIGLWLLAAVVLFYPAERLYAWLMLGDLVANRTKHLALARTLRTIHRWPAILRGCLLVLTVALLWSAVFFLCHVPQSLGWTVVLPTVGFFCGLTFHRRQSRQAQAAKVAQLAEQGVVLADLAHDDGIIRAEIVGAPEPEPTMGGVWRGMAPEMRWLLGIVACGALAGVLIICGGGGYLAVKTSGDREAQEVADLVRGHPIIQEQLGGIDRCEFNLFLDLDEGSRSKHVYDVHGPKASGVLIAHEFFYQYDSIKLRIGNEEWELLEE